MNLANPPERYDRTDQAQVRASLEREDRRNIKTGVDVTITDAKWTFAKDKIILTSPNGTKYYLEVSNAGALSTTAV